MKPRLRISIRRLAGSAALLGLAACASFPEKKKPPDADESRALQADTSRLGFNLVYLIHGDAGYAYHDASGKQRAADEDAVAGALDVARGSTQGEVFIFHQRPATWHWFHRGPDGFLTHYRRGRLLHAEGYSRREFGMDFGAETALYRRYAAASALHFFAYYGHEIPAQDGAGYSASYPDRNFSLSEMARGLRGFSPLRPIGSPAGKPFALIVLSTCHGGTPATIAALADYADYVIASPADLHLSFFDTHAFLRLSRIDSASRDDSAFHAGGGPAAQMDVRALAAEIKDQSFRRLQENTQTEITVAVYDVEAARPFLKTALERPRVAPDTGNCGPDAGVEMLYQPPRFGENKNRAIRSGWECGGN